MAKRLTPETLPRDLKEQMDGLSRRNRKRFNRRIIGHAMDLVVKMRFAMAEGPNREEWKSSADETKFNGKFSVRYKKRPSGSPVTAGARRLSDTGELAAAYGILHSDANHVTVGPLRRAKGGKAHLIAERAESDWGNQITGWDRIATKVVELEISEGLDEVMRGRGIDNIPIPTPWKIRRQF